MAADENRRKSFFDALVEDGYTFGKEESTERAAFDSLMNDPAWAKRTHKALVDDGWELDDFDTWYEDFGPEKKSEQQNIEDAEAVRQQVVAQAQRDAEAGQQQMDARAAEQRAKEAQKQAAAQAEQPSMAATPIQETAQAPLQETEQPTTAAAETPVQEPVAEQPAVAEPQQTEPVAQQVPVADGGRFEFQLGSPTDRAKQMQQDLQNRVVANTAETLGMQEGVREFAGAQEVQDQMDSAIKGAVDEVNKEIAKRQSTNMVAAGGGAGMSGAVVYNAARAMSDMAPSKIADAAYSELDRQGIFDQYVQQKYGSETANDGGDTNADEPKGEDALAELDEARRKEVERIMQKEAQVFAMEIQQQLVDRYKDSKKVGNAGEYIASSAFLNSIAGRIYQGLASRMGAREYLAMLNENLQGYDAGFATQGAAGAASMILDTPFFMLGGVAGGALTSMATRATTAMLGGTAVRFLSVSPVVSGIGRIMQRALSSGGTFAGYETMSKGADLFADEKEYSVLDVVKALGGAAAEGFGTGVALGVIGGIPSEMTRNASRIGRFAGGATGFAGELGYFSYNDMKKYMEQNGVEWDDVPVGQILGKQVVMLGLMRMQHIDQIIDRYKSKITKQWGMELTSDDLANLRDAGYWDGKGGLIDAEKFLYKFGSESYDFYRSIMSNDNIPISTRAKLRYIVEGKMSPMGAAFDRDGNVYAATDPVSGSYDVQTVEKDGTYYVTTFDENGRVTQVLRFKSKKEATNYHNAVAGQVTVNVVRCGEMALGKMDPEALRQCKERFNSRMSGNKRIGNIDDILAKPFDQRTDAENALVADYGKELYWLSTLPKEDPTLRFIEERTDAETGTFKQGTDKDGRPVTVKGEGETVVTTDMETGEVKMRRADAVVIEKEGTPEEAAAVAQQAAVEAAAAAAMTPKEELEADKAATVLQQREQHEKAPYFLRWNGELVPLSNIEKRVDGNGYDVFDMNGDKIATVAPTMIEDGDEVRQAEALQAEAEAKRVEEEARKAAEKAAEEAAKAEEKRIAERDKAAKDAIEKAKDLRALNQIAESWTEEMPKEITEAWNNKRQEIMEAATKEAQRMSRLEHESHERHLKEYGHLTLAQLKELVKEPGRENPTKEEFHEQAGRDSAIAELIQQTTAYEDAVGKVKDWDDTKIDATIEKAEKGLEERKLTPEQEAQTRGVLRAVKEEKARREEEKKAEQPSTDVTGRDRIVVARVPRPGEKVKAAEKEVETNPTDAQKEAGNYKKGHVRIDGYDITIENPKGSVRSGKDASGKEWSVTMNNTYGYIRGTESVDGDHIDIFLSDHPETGKVFVVDQVKNDGSFDEHKVMYGFDSEEEARDAYLANYSEGWKGLGNITGVSKDEFKEWVNSSHRKTKPFADYRDVKESKKDEGPTQPEGKEEVKEEKKQPKAEEPKEEPKKHNFKVSDEEMDDIAAKIRAKFGRLNIGADPELLTLGIKFAFGKLERGVVKFADFCKEMVETFGDAIRPYLKQFYNSAKDDPDMTEELLNKMDSYEAVRAFDVMNFDKATVDNLKKVAEDTVKKAEEKKKANDKIKPQSDEQEVHVRPGSGTAEREGGHQRGQNEPLGASQRHEDERADTGGVAGRGGSHTVPDTAGSPRVSESSDGKRNVKPTKPEPAPLAENERKNTRNNHADRGTDYAPKSVSARIDANIKAIETMQRLIESGEPATPEDMAVLRKFSGWGGLGEAFKEKTGWNDNPTNKRLRELLSPEAYEAANMSRNSAYYTPAPVIDAMWDVARAMGFRGGNVLEGSAGIGNILGLMPTDMSERSNILAVEIDETTGNLLKLLYPDAKVEVKGFEKTHVPNGSVDLAITNVPFVTGLRVMDETGDKDLSRKFHDIHDFCIAKNVRKLKEGGVGIFITSSGTLDSPNSAKLRTWLVNEGGADVVGAFRMHNQTFGGTGATSDIIVIRKRVNGKKSANAIDVSGTLPIRTVKYNTGETKRGSNEVIVKDLALDVNKYFVEHPENMAGEMAFAFEKGDTYRATSKALYPSKDIDQEKRMAEWAQQFKDMDWEKAEERETQQVVYEDLGAGVKEGSMLLDKSGNLCLAQRGKAVPLRLNANKVKGHTKAECFNAYKAVKDALADALEYQTTHSDDKGLKQKLDALNKAYDDFVSTYGHLNKNTSISFLRNDMDYPSIAALESVSETGDKSGKRIVNYGKTDIFSRRVVDKESEPKPTDVKDGIIASIYLNGRVDVPYIAEQLGKSENEVREEIIKSGLGFENPTTTEMEVSYEYLSGNVREKLRQAMENNTNGRYDANIKALERVIPMDIPAHLIEFTLGSSWVEPKLYEDFVKERTGLDVKLTNAGGTWVMKEPYYTNTEQNRAMGVISKICDTTILGHELIKAAITCKSIRVAKTVTNGYGSSKTTETIVDKDATMACANKVDEIRQDFKDWARGKMQADPEMSERMERVYNDLFNNYVPKEIPDDFVPEHFGGAATVVGGKPFKLRPHQAKAVIRATTQPLMLAHEVGTGKTYTLITTAMEMRRLGTARKPMIVVQNATVGQFVGSAKALYPNAKILTLEDADRNAEGRRNFYAKIRYNDWDMIVVPQSVFERIPDSEERQIRFIEDKVEEKMITLEKMREAANNDRDPAVRQAERELEELDDQLNELKLAIQARKTGGKAEKDEKREAKTKQNAAVKAQEMLDRETDDVVNFDDMGIDALLIDEAHEYKHLGFSTAMQRGVKGVDPSYSKKSQGVYLKTQAVLENKNGKNVVFATGTPISNTAAEIWTFMRYLMPADTMREYGIYYFDDFVRNFGNIQQMLEFATNGKYKENNRFAGYVNLPELVRIWSGVADTVLTRDAGGVSDKIPKMEGGKAQDVYLPQTKALRSVMKFVKAQLDEYDKMSGKEKKENSHIPIVMYGIAKAAAVDARLVLGDASDEPNSKTNETVRQTLRSLEDTKEYNGTVAIFADNYQNKTTGFNLYEDIRKKLIKAGVPESQIVVMKSGMSVKKKLEIFDRVNRGEVRVIMGSTFTLGTGVNIQERLHTLIHVDAPNRPMDYTQRNGRILRQGNLHNQWGTPVRVLRMGVEDSLDVTAYQRLKTKGAIADSIMNGKKMMSNSMENRVLEEEQDLFGDITAQLSGSQYALLVNQIEKEVKKLEVRMKQYEADQTYVHNQIPRLKALIKDSIERAAHNKEMLAKVEAAKVDGITIGKNKFPALDTMDDFIKDYNSKQREQQDRVRTMPGDAKIASDLTLSVGGFDFTVHREITKEYRYNGGQPLSFYAKTQMTYSCPELGLKEMQVDGQWLRSALEEITDLVMTGKLFRERADYAERAEARYKNDLQQVEARNGKPFEYADDLKQAKEKLAEYRELMRKEMAEKEAKYAEMDASVQAATGVNLTDEDSEEANETENEAMYGETDDSFVGQLRRQANEAIERRQQERQEREDMVDEVLRLKYDGDEEAIAATKMALTALDRATGGRVVYETDESVRKMMAAKNGGGENAIQGLKGYTEQEVLDAVRADIYARLEEAEVEGVELKGMALHGSRMRGDAREDSDLDVVVEYTGDMSEDGLFNIINDEPIEIEGVRVDVNPITEGKSGTLDEYMERSRAYDAEKGQPRMAADGDATEFHIVKDKAEIERLENEPTIKVYRAMQLRDGKLYPPMAGKVNGEWQNPVELGQWERADEHPELADKDGKFKLDKGNGTSLKARYNPYFHTSRTPLNDQFSSAQSRPELVTVETEVPKSELTSGYKADKAKDAVGAVEWKAGVVQSQLSGTREVILSRWDKPVRIVPDSEVAQKIVEMFGDKKVVMPSNVVTPSLRSELEKLGVSFRDTDNRGRSANVEMRTSDGTVYGWKDGKGVIHLSLDGLNADTPVHEYSHLWFEVLKRRNRELWQSVMDRVREALNTADSEGEEVRRVLDEILGDESYRNIRDDEERLTSEILARLSGKKGRERMNEAAREAVKNRSFSWKVKSAIYDVLDKLKDAVAKAWNWIGKNIFRSDSGVKSFSSIDEITDRVLYDFLNGTDMGPDGGGGGGRREYSIGGRRSPEVEARQSILDMKGVKEVQDLATELKRLQDKQGWHLEDRPTGLKDGAGNPIMKKVWVASNDPNTIKMAAEDALRFVRDKVSGVLSKELGAMELKKILRDIAAASTSQELGRPLFEVSRIINDAIIRKVERQTNELMATKVEKLNDRGVPVGRLVDPEGRNLFNEIRKANTEILTTTVDTDLDRVKKEYNNLVTRRRRLAAGNPKEEDEAYWDATTNTYDGAHMAALEADIRDKEIELEGLRAKHTSDVEANIAEAYDKLAADRDRLENEIGAYNSAGAPVPPEVMEEYCTVLPIRENLAIMHEARLELAQIRKEWQQAIDDLHAIKRAPGYMAARKAKQRECDNLEANYMIQQGVIRDAMIAVAEGVKTILDEGKDRLTLIRQQELEHKKFLVADAIDDVKRPNLKVTHQEKADSAENPWWYRVVNTLQDPMKSLNFMLQWIDENHANGEGKLYTRFMKDPEGVVGANDRMWQQKKQTRKDMDAKVLDVFGKKMDVNALQKKGGDSPFLKLGRDSKKDLGVDIEKYVSKKELTAMQSNKMVHPDVIGRFNSPDDVIDGYHKIRVKGLTKGNALYIWLTWQQADGQEKLVRMGYNQDSIDQIESALGPEYIEFARWITDDYLKGLRDKYFSPRHEELFGISMGDTPHYFPLKIDKSTVFDKRQIGEDQKNYMPSLMVPNLIKRNRNSSEIDTTTDALEVLNRYTDTMWQWWAMGPIIKDVNTLHASPRFKEYMEANRKGSFAELMKAFEVATGATAERERDVVNDIVGKLTSAGATAAIAFKTSIALKQFLSFDAFRAYAASPRFQAELTRNILTPWACMKWAYETLPSYEQRRDEGDMGMEFMRQENMFDVARYISKAGLYANRFIDRWTVAAGAKAVYDESMRKLVSEGWDKNKAHRWSVIEAEITFNKSQQSSRPEFSSWAQKNGNAFTRSLLLFTNGPTGYARQIRLAQWNLYKMAQAAADGKVKGWSKRELHGNGSHHKAWTAAGALAAIAIFGLVLPSEWQLGGNTNNVSDIANPSSEMNEADWEAYKWAIAEGLLTDGTYIGSAVKSVVNGYDYEPIHLLNMINEIKDMAQDGEADPIMAHIVDTALKYQLGLDINTFATIWAGAKGMATEDYESETIPMDLYLDLLLMLHSNKTDRRGWARELYSKYGPTAYAKAYEKASMQNNTDRKVTQLAHEYVKNLNEDFYNDMMEWKPLTEEHNAKVTTPERRAEIEAMPEWQLAARYKDWIIPTMRANMLQQDSTGVAVKNNPNRYLSDSEIVNILNNEMIPQWKAFKESQKGEE